MLSVQNSNYHMLFLNWEKKPAIETKWDSINGQHFDLINKAGQLSLFDKQKPWEKWNE